MWNLKGRGQRQRRYSRQNLNTGAGLYWWYGGGTLLKCRPSLAAKTVKLVRTGHSQSSWINAILLHLCLPVAPSDTYPEDMYRHTTTPPWRTRGWAEDVSRMEQSKTSVPPGFISLGCRCVLCVYLGSLSCPCWDPWPRPSSYIREAWKRALGHLEGPISSQRTGYGEVLREDGDWETVWQTTGRVDE